MPVYGKIVVIRRNGSDGSHFSVTNSSCLFGRNTDCDVRIQMPFVSSEQCKISLDENGKFVLHNLSETNITLINGKPVVEPVIVEHKDMLTIVDRSFRFEYPETQRKVVRTPQKSSIKGKSPKRTPLGESKSTVNQQSGTDSPFSKLVSDMKESIKNKVPAKKDEQKSVVQKENSVEEESPVLRRSPRTSTNGEVSAIGSSSKDKNLKNGSTPNADSAADRPASTEQTGLGSYVAAEPLVASPRSAEQRKEPEELVEKEMTPKRQPAGDAKASDSLDKNESNVPVISLTPQTSGEPDSDPYEFPDAGKGSQKKLRRRSFGSTSVNRKQALLLFGSPRTPSATSLRKSMGEIRRKSIPLVEQDAEDEPTPAVASKTKKSWDPLPEVQEVENNSSPVKKPMKAQMVSRPSPLIFDESARSLRRKSHRVSFGPQLSPEQFLNHLPPNTPVRKGATPTSVKKSSKRKSLAASGASTLSRVDETTPKTASKQRKTPPTSKPVPARTPTPYRLASSKKRPKSLLRNVLSAAYDKRVVEKGSPVLPLKSARAQLPAEKVAQLESSNVDGKTVEETGNAVEAPVISAVSPGMPVKQQRRRSSGRVKAKPLLWADVVKKAPVAQNSYSSKNSSNRAISKKKRLARKQEKLLVLNEGHHIDSPATLYIGKTRSRVRPTRTPRVPRAPAPAILDIPANESFTGIPEMFQTPDASSVTSVASETPETTGCDHSLYSSLGTPDTVGSMFVSPMTGRRSGGAKLALSTSLDFGASPQLIGGKRRSRSGAIEGQAGAHVAGPSLHESEATALEPPKKKKKNLPVDGKLGTKRSLKSPRAKDKGKPVKSKLGTGRLLKTPKNKEKVEPVETHLGTKRLLTTPKQKVKVQPVKEKLGLKRLLKTPRDKQKSVPVSDKFGTKRLLKTPKVKARQEPVEGNLGMKRLLATPRNKVKTAAVEEKLGLKRLMKTPKERVTAEAVEEHFGTKRLLKTPRTKDKTEPVKDKFGTKRLFTTPADKCKGQAVENEFGTSRLFSSPKAKAGSVENHFGTARLFQAYAAGKRKEPRQESDVDDLHLDKLMTSPEGWRGQEPTLPAQEKRGVPARGKKRGKAVKERPDKPTRSAVSKQQSSDIERVEDMCADVTTDERMETRDVAVEEKQTVEKKGKVSSKKKGRKAVEAESSAKVEEQTAVGAEVEGGKLTKTVSFHSSVVGGFTPVPAEKTRRGRRTATEANTRSGKAKRTREEGEMTASAEINPSPALAQEVDSTALDLAATRTSGKAKPSGKRGRKTDASKGTSAGRSARSNDETKEVVDKVSTETVEANVTELSVESVRPEGVSPPKRSRRGNATKSVEKGSGDRAEDKKQTTRRKVVDAVKEVPSVLAVKDNTVPEPVVKAKSTRSRAAKMSEGKTKGTDVAPQEIINQAVETDVGKRQPTKRSRKGMSGETCKTEETKMEETQKNKNMATSEVVKQEEDVPAKRPRRGAQGRAKLDAAEAMKPATAKTRRAAAAEVKAAPVKKTGKAKMDEKVDDPVEDVKPRTTRRRGKAASDTKQVTTESKEPNSDGGGDEETAAEKQVKRIAGGQTRRKVKATGAVEPKPTTKTGKTRKVESTETSTETVLRRSSRRKK